MDILKTSIGEVTVDHQLAQSYDAKSGKIELLASSARCSCSLKCVAGTSQKSTNMAPAMNSRSC